MDIHLHIPDGSQLGQRIYALAAEEHITPEQALDRVIKVGLEHTQEDVIEDGLGLFSSQEDRVALDAAVSLAYEERRRPS